MIGFNHLRAILDIDPTKLIGIALLSLSISCSGSFEKRQQQVVALNQEVSQFKKRFPSGFCSFSPEYIDACGKWLTLPMPHGSSESWDIDDNIQIEVVDPNHFNPIENKYLRSRELEQYINALDALKSKIDAPFSSIFLSKSKKQSEINRLENEFELFSSKESIDNEIKKLKQYRMYCRKIGLSISINERIAQAEHKNTAKLYIHSVVRESSSGNAYYCLTNRGLGLILFDKWDNEPPIRSALRTAIRERDFPLGLTVMEVSSTNSFIPILPPEKQSNAFDSLFQLYSKIILKKNPIHQTTVDIRSMDSETMEIMSKDHASYTFSEIKSDPTRYELKKTTILTGEIEPGACFITVTDKKNDLDRMGIAGYNVKIFYSHTSNDRSSNKWNAKWGLGNIIPKIVLPGGFFVHSYNVPYFLDSPKGRALELTYKSQTIYRPQFD